MSYLTKIILFVSVLASSAYAQGTTQLNIRTNTDDAMIFIDGEFAGNRSVETDVQFGEHEVFVTKRGRSWNAERFTDTISVDGKSSVYELCYEFQTPVYVNSKPQNGGILFHDSLIAYTPSLIAPKYNSLVLSKKDFTPVTVDLSEVHGAPVKLDFSGVVKKEHFVDTPWFKVLIGSAVALGATAAYYKIQADQKYDKYNETHDRSLLDDIDRLDLYSGIAFGLLQVNFGYLIYEFIFID